MRRHSEKLFFENKSVTQKNINSGSEQKFMVQNNPFKNSDTNRRFHTYDYYLRRRFGRKCAKVPIDGGFCCPNIDGTCGTGGCSYCVLPQKNRSSALPPLEEQYISRLSDLRKKWPNCVGLPYLQDYTNTYAPVETLKEIYQKALSLPDSVGLHIATRADCLPDETVRLLSDIARRHYLVVELGLQTIHDKTAERINRGHSYSDFLEGYSKLTNSSVNVCVHIINGLPGETEEMMLETASALADLSPHSLKIHLLHVMEGTRMAEEYRNGEFAFMSLEKYTDIVVSQIELMPPEVVIERVTGDGMADKLIGPEWSTKKFVVMNEIDKEFVRRNSMQGMHYIR